MNPAARSLALAFPIFLLFFATFFLLGQIGFWSDDYWHNQRDPVTGALPDLWAGGSFSIGPLLIDRGFFLRPLFYVTVPLVTTLSWNTPWAVHLLMVLAHGAATVLLFRLMARIGLARAPSAAAAILWMVYPIQFEAVFWVSALPTELAVVLMLWVMHMHVAIARGRTMAWRLPAIAVGAFGVCCLNEQPAVGVFAMPFLYLAAGGLRPRELDRGHVVRALAAPFVAGCAVLLYLYMMKRGIPAIGIHPVPKGIRGSAETLVGLSEMPERLREFGRSLWPRIWMKNLAAGAFRTGLAELRAQSGPAIAWLLMLAVSGAAWCVWFLRAGERCASNITGQDCPALRASWSIAFGAAVYVIGFLPPALLAVYLADSRLMYWPSIGLAVCIASIGTLLARRARAKGMSRGLRGATAAGLVCVMLFWSVCYIGIQAAFRNRWEMDQHEGAQLRALLPNPEPLTFFVPMRIDSRAVRTGSPVFDVHHRSVWEFAWTVPKFIQSAMRSDQVRCGYWKSWTPSSPVKGADETGIHFTDRLGPKYPRIEGSGSRVSWDRAAPFVVDSDGRVHLITTIVITEPGKADVSIPVPQAKRAGAPRFEWKLPRA